MEYEKKILICEDNLAGICTAVYDGWKWGSAGMDVEIVTREPECPEFFCTCVSVKTDMEKSRKVTRSIYRKLGREAYEAVCYSAISTYPQKGTVIFRMLQKALKKDGYGREIMKVFADPDVNLVSKLRIRVWHEFHRYFGFVRFREVGAGVLFARIAPENDILEMLAPHFSDRFPNENWMIYDERRHKVLTHPKGGECTVHSRIMLGEEYRDDLAEPEIYETLWRSFCENITISERRNPGLQQQLVPLKFREHMLEFQ